MASAACSIVVVGSTSSDRGGVVAVAEGTGCFSSGVGKVDERAEGLRRKVAAAMRKNGMLQ